MLDEQFLDDVARPSRPPLLFLSRCLSRRPPSRLLQYRHTAIRLQSAHSRLHTQSASPPTPAALASKAVESLQRDMCS